MTIAIDPAPFAAIIVEILGVEIARVTDDARLVEDLGMDELDTIELIMSIEETYGIPEEVRLEDEILTDATGRAAAEILLKDGIRTVAELRAAVARHATVTP